MLEVECPRASEFELRPKGDAWDRHNFHLSGAFRRAGAYSFLRHFVCEVIRDLSHHDAMFREEGVVFAGILLGWGAVGDKEDAWEDSVVVLGLSGGVYQYGFLVVVRGGVNSYCRLSVGFSPGDFPPAYVNGNGVGAIAVRVVPRANDCGVSREVYGVVYRRLEFTYDTQDRVRW